MQAAPAKLDYIKDGAEIYRRSFAMIRAESALAGIPADIEPIVVRLIHTSGMTGLASAVAFHPEIIRSGRAALNRGAPIFCDAKMIASGITRTRLPANNEIICTLDHPDTAKHAAKLGTTRSAAAIDFWRDRIEGAVVAIGNAPTALFHLLERLDQGWPKPAIIIGVPVGFVGAAESKDELVRDCRGVPYFVVTGRQGGSALAVAAINAIACERE